MHINIIVTLKPWQYNQCFQSYPVTKRTHSYLTYVNNFLYIKVRIHTKCFKILEDQVGRKSNYDIFVHKGTLNQIAVSYT